MYPEDCKALGIAMGFKKYQTFLSHLREQSPPEGRLYRMERICETRIKAATIEKEKTDSEQI